MKPSLFLPVLLCSVACATSEGSTPSSDSSGEPGPAPTTAHPSSEPASMPVSAPASMPVSVPASKPKLVLAPGGQPTASGQPSSPPGGGSSSKPMTPDMKPIVDKCRADLAERLGVAAEEIEVALAQRVVWRNSGLGCPPPEGAFYAQVLTNGSRVHLVHGKTRFAYHAGPDDDPFFCKHPQDPLPPSEGGLE